jgi:hypothetical protein
MNTLSKIKRNLYMLYWKYPELKNKNYNYLYFKYCLEFHEKELCKISASDRNNPVFWEKMPAMESISRCKRKLAQNDELFRPTNKKIINQKLKQQKEILESIRNND